MLIEFKCFHYCSIYTVHDEVKDKAFQLEMSWVGEGKSETVNLLVLTECAMSCVY